MIGFIKTALDFLNKYKSIILLAGIGVLIYLLFQTCEKNEELKSKKNALEQNIRQNEMALKDSSAVIQTQEDKIVNYDQALANLKDSIEKIEDQKPDEIYYTKFKYKNKELDIPNNLIRTDSNTYGLNFFFEDKVMTFEGTSYFSIHNMKKTIKIEPEHTKVLNRDINFGVALYKFTRDGIKRVGAKPYHILNDGSFGEQINSDILELKYRGVQIQNSPTENKETTSPSRIGVSINVPSVGYYYTPKGWQPGIGASISLSYRIF